MVVYPDFSCNHAVGLNGDGNGQIPVAVLVNYDSTDIDTTGSQGDEVQTTITRNGTVIEISPETPNDGTTEVPHIIVLQNGDVICVSASYNNFATVSIVCKAIPTPQFGFVPVN